MPIDAVRTRDPGRFRNSRPQRYVRAAPIVENDELLKYGPQMALTDWNQDVETLTPKTSDQALAKSVAWWAPRGRLQHTQTHLPHCAIDVSRENRIAAVNQDTVLVLAIKGLAKLLGSPFGCRMRNHVAMQNASGASLIATNTYTTRNVAVTDWKKSEAKTAFE